MFGWVGLFWFCSCCLVVWFVGGRGVWFLVVGLFFFFFLKMCSNLLDVSDNFSLSQWQRYLMVGIE